MTYVNPFLVDTSENPEIKVNLFKEAKKEWLPSSRRTWRAIYDSKHKLFSWYS